MNFRRIESIFLIIFVVLDVFLFFSYRNQSSSFETNSSNNVSQSMAHEMEEDNITVPRLSGKKYQAYYLSSTPNDDLVTSFIRLHHQNVTLNDDQSMLKSTLQTPLKATKKQSLTQAVKDYTKTKTNVLFGSNYVYLASLSTQDNIIFGQKFANGVLMDENGQLNFKVNNHQVASYTQTYLKKPTVLREKETTISEKNAIVSLYTNNELANNTTVKWIKLGYSHLMTINDSDIYIPAWFIGIKAKNSPNLTIKRVNAFTGSIMKTSD